MSDPKPATGPDARVGICTVTHNSADVLESWWSALASVHARRHNSVDPDFSIVAVDCASGDGSAELLEALAERHPDVPLRVVAAEQNLGFAGGMNRALEELDSSHRWVLALNPDAQLRAGTLRALIEAFDRYSSQAPHQPRVGAVTARLLRQESDHKGSARKHAGQLDACGMYWTRSWRHLDRGSGEPAQSRFTAPEEVVAGTGAGTMYLAEALRDIELAPEVTLAGTSQVFDEDFHSFREDAELGLRLQRRAWTCIYEPNAVIVHRRFNLPERRRSINATINRKSLENRYLLRLLHQSRTNQLRCLHALVRDIGILGYVLLRERTSLPAYRWLWRHRKRLLARRRWLAQRASAPASALERWFARPSYPLRIEPR